MGCYFMVNNNEEMRNIISAYEIVRNKINNEKRLLENVDFRLKQNPSDQMWQSIKGEHVLRLKGTEAELGMLEQQMRELKKKSGDSEWHEFLTNIGFVIAKTERIEHVANNLSDEFDLKKAIDNTSNRILAIQEELVVANEQKDEDTKILLEAQLQFYKEDMKQHFWGEERLKQILTDEAPSR